MWAGDANGNGHILVDGTDNDISAIENSILQYQIDINFVDGDGNPLGGVGFTGYKGYLQTDLNLDYKVRVEGSNNDKSVIDQNLPIFQIDLHGEIIGGPGYTGMTERLP